MVLLLLLAAPCRAGEVERLIERLQDEDPRGRRAAQAAIRRLGPSAIEPLVASLDHGDPEVRRFVRQFLSRELREGDPVRRRRILESLVGRGREAIGFVPELEAIAKRFDGELGLLARIASMRIAQTRSHVVFLARREEAYPALLAFDPQRAAALRATAKQMVRQPALRSDLESYLHLLAGAKPRADPYLAERVATAEGKALLVWLGIAARLKQWPGGMAAILAKRIREESARPLLMALADALLRGPPQWAAAGSPVADAVLARLGNATVYERPHLVLVLARCRDTKVVRALQEEAKRGDAAGFAARCALHARGIASVPDPVAALRALGAIQRYSILGHLVLSGDPVCLPLFLDRLRDGDEEERRILLASADAMHCARDLLPALAEVGAHGRIGEIGRALGAIAKIDPWLRWPGTARALRRGLRHPKSDVRSKAVFACDDIAVWTPSLVAEIERLAEDREVAAALAWLLPNLGRLGTRGRLLVPLLSRIVVRGAPAGLLWGGKSALRWRRECVAALSRIDASHAASREAFRAALAASDPQTRVLAMLAFRGVERPSPGDRAAVRRVTKDKDERVRRAATMVLLTPAWKQAAPGPAGK